MTTRPATARKIGRSLGLGWLRLALRWLLRPAHDRELRTDSVAAGLVDDIFRRRSQLLLENALLRQQLQVLKRSVKRPRIRATDRLGLLLLARLTSRWRSVLVIIQPETLLRWHRDAFRAFWRRRSHRGPGRPELASETVALIRRMASENRLWGAERIRGELLKVGISVSKRTIQKYMHSIRRDRPAGQNWATFLRNHGARTWAADFLQLHDARFRPIFAFFIIAHHRRRVMHVGATRHPTDAWVAQQLREATPWGAAPQFLIRDRDQKFGVEFERVAAATSIRTLRTAVRAPKMNAHCERFLGSVRRECLDHTLILGEGHLRALLGEYVDDYHGRPHQGLAQQPPFPREPSLHPHPSRVLAVPVLGGLHHDYRMAA